MNTQMTFFTANSTYAQGIYINWRGYRFLWVVREYHFALLNKIKAPEHNAVRQSAGGGPRYNFRADKEKVPGPYVVPPGNRLVGDRA
ncbi:MAG TPA: hypothetical protein VMW50_13960 [Dehalococcoidia bacterium]|nr:hypothetical protein [Dehalococcoidia bacterium]